MLFRVEWYRQKIQHVKYVIVVAQMHHQKTNELIRNYFGVSLLKNFWLQCSESMLDTFYNCTGSKTSVINIIVLFLRHPEHDLVSKVNAISIRYFARFALGSDSPPLVTRGGDKGECSAPRKRKVMKRRGLHDVTLHRSSFNSHAEEGKRHGFA